MLIAIAAITLLLRAIYIGRFHIDGDEPQHLHVVWGWTQGLVQYRDLFDNHTPLFHLLYAPVLALVGERATVFLWMRAAELPLYFVALWSCYRIGHALFSRSAGVLAAIVLALLPPFFLTSIEFRADNLWVAFWLLALVALVEQNVTPVRGWAVGALLGLALAASLKTICLLVALSLGCFVSTCQLADPFSRAYARVASLLTALAGFAIVIALLLVSLAALGALSAFFRCAFAHNAESFGLWSERIPRVALFLVSIPIAWFVARALLRFAPDEHVGIRRAVVGSTAIFYFSIFNGFFPLITDQDFLPFYPLLVVLCAPLLQQRTPARWSLAAVAFAEIILIVITSPPWKDGTGIVADRIAAVLSLTDSGDLVMDAKGEAVFRRRPIEEVFETVTLERVRLGQIRDDVGERLIASRTHVALVPDEKRLPAGARRFLNENYVPVGPLRVAGKLLRSENGASGNPLEFDVAIPGRYAVVSPSGRLGGILDGAPCDGTAFLGAGHHQFSPARPADRVAILWERSVLRGYSPY